MNNASRPDDNLDELLAGRVLGDLTSDEERVLRTRGGHTDLVSAEQLERVAAAIHLALVGPQHSAFPKSLYDKILKNAATQISANADRVKPVISEPKLAIRDYSLTRREIITWKNKRSIKMNSQSACRIFAIAIVLATAARSAQCQETKQETKQETNQETEQEMSDDRLLPNLPLPTLGGKQFWTDHRWCNGWRLQHNVVSDTWRVLDARNTRLAWGGRQACQKEFEARCIAENAPTAAHIVVLVHGLMRTSSSTNGLADAIKRETKMEPAAFGYASTRDSIADHAAALRDWSENLPGNPQLSFVGHSLGNIVVRHAIGDWQRQDTNGVLKRLDRVVMLGPPNNGSSLATKLSRLGLFDILVGKSGSELGPKWDKLQTQLSIPPCPFAIIAGDLSDSSLRNPLMVREGDLVVTVEETILPGAETLSVPVLHSFLPTDSRAIEPTIRFLNHQPLVLPNR